MNPFQYIWSKLFPPMRSKILSAAIDIDEGIKFLAGVGDEVELFFPQLVPIVAELHLAGTGLGAVIQNYAPKKTS